MLAGTRNAVAWAALGHATAAYEIAVGYCTQRQQFGKPLVSFQIVQDRLVKMLAEVCSMQLYCLRLGRLIEEGKLTDTIAAMAKMNNTRKARQVIAEARDLLGGNGILLDYHVMRHMADIEAIHTYEGTETIQTLIVGRDITGCRRLRLTRPTIRFVDVDGRRLRTSVAGASGRPAAADHRHRRQPRPGRRSSSATRPHAGSQASASTPPGSAVRRLRLAPTDAGARPDRRADARRARVRPSSTCSASPSAGCSPSSWPTRPRAGCAGSCSRPPVPASAAYPVLRAALLPLLTPRRYHQPDYFRRIAGRVYGGDARRDPDALLLHIVTRLEPPSAMGLPRPALRDQSAGRACRWLRHAPAARPSSWPATTTRSFRSSTPGPHDPAAATHAASTSTTTATSD